MYSALLLVLVCIGIALSLMLMAEVFEYTSYGTTARKYVQIIALTLTVDIVLIVGLLMGGVL